MVICTTKASVNRSNALLGTASCTADSYVNRDNTLLATSIVTCITITASHVLHASANRDYSLLCIDVCTTSASVNKLIPYLLLFFALQMPV